MKILQQLPLGFNPTNNLTTTPADLNLRILFDPADYTGVTHIYFATSSNVDNVAVTGKVELYNVETGATISQIAVTQTTQNFLKSTDCKANLTTKQLLGIRIYLDGASGAHYINGLYNQLIIEQDDSTTSRKTMSSVHASDYFSTNYTGGYLSDNTSRIRVLPNLTDGFKTLKLEGYMKADAGGNADVILFDVTGNVAVDGAHFTSMSTTWVRVITANLVLDPTHVYQMRAKSLVVGKYGYSTCFRLNLRTGGFETIVSIPWEIGFGYQFDWISPYYQPAKMLFERTKITAPDGLTFKFLGGWFTFYPPPVPYIAGFKDDDAGTYFDGLYWHRTDSDEYYFDVALSDISPSASDHYLGLTDSIAHIVPHDVMVLAIQTENLPIPPHVTPNPNMPTGYHCFMSQFIKSLFAGFVPLKTPDGMNRCWP
jgi:hypothetical protein